MASADFLSEDTISLPNGHVCSASGLALDIGGSIAKIIYRSKKEYQDGVPCEKQKSDIGLLHLAMFDADKIEDIIQYIKNHCDLHQDSKDNVTVHATGIGSNVFKSKLEAELGIKIKIVDEFDCFVRAFIWMLKNTPKEQLVLPQSEAALEEGKRITRSYQKWIVKMGMKEESSQTHETTPEIPEQLPTILAMCGSATVLILINKDGTHRVIDGINVGGRFFSGVAQCLVEEKDYSTLMEMTKNGDGKSVDTYYSDLIKNKTGEGVYEADEDDKVVYPFGKVSQVGKDKVEANDLVCSLTNVLGTVHAQVIQLNALVHGVKEVYFCGNLFSSEPARGAIESLHFVRSYLAPADKRINFNFLRNGGGYGALGAYLVDETSSETATLDNVAISTHL